MRSTDSLSAESVARRFWMLIVIILLVTVLASAIAVRFFALPFFRDYQQNAIEAQAQKSAAQLAAELEHNEIIMSMIASDPNLVNIALGYDQNPSYLPDFLRALKLPKELSWVTFYDVFNDRISNFDVRAWERTYFDAGELETLLSQVHEAPLATRQPVLLETRRGVAYLVLATPVLHEGFVEGALLSAYRLDTNAIFRANEVAKQTRIVASDGLMPWSDGAILHYPLATFDLAIALEPDQAAVEQAGLAVLSNSVAAIAIVLVGAFGIFALVGRATIVEPHRALATQKAELAELAAIAERANDAITITDLRGRLVWANPAFETLTGHRVEDVRGRTPGSFLQGSETDEATREQIRRALERKEAIQVEIRNYRKPDTEYWVSLSISPLIDSNGKTYGFMSISNDITEARLQQEAIVQAKKEIELQALHDPLTGLPNRRALDQAMRRRMFEPALETTIVRIDLDHFKYVNDTMGHEAGDFLLCEVARILLEETKSTDLAARVGGDEFVLLLEEKATPCDAEALARRMLTRIQEPKAFENKLIRVGASFGIASTLDRLLKADELIIGADAALYQAKESGRNQVHLYTPALHQTVLSRRALASEFRLAVSRSEFEPFFQPQFDANTLDIVGVETLARWQSDRFGLLLPGEFLPVAEQLSLVEEIDDIIFQKALSQIRHLRERDGIDISKVSVNVTVDRIMNDKVYQTILDHPQGDLEIAFEVLESVLVEEQSDLFRYGLDRLREAGVKIEVDDFGSGHASVVGLMHLRPDAMKIDQRLVRPITVDPLARGLLSHIVGMAQLMDLQIIAEGVETHEHSEILRDIGCHVLQGYAYCRPMPASDLTAFVRQHEARQREARLAVG